MNNFYSFFCSSETLLPCNDPGKRPDTNPWTAAKFSFFIQMYINYKLIIAGKIVSVHWLQLVAIKDEGGNLCIFNDNYKTDSVYSYTLEGMGEIFHTYL